MEILKEQNSKVLHIKRSCSTEDLHEFLKDKYPSYNDYQVTRTGPHPDYGNLTVVHLFKDLQ